MLFNSLPFLVFFPLVCVIYYALPRVIYRNVFLLAASYIFYMSWQPVYLLLLLSVTAISYVAGLMLTNPRPGRYRGYVAGCGIILVVSVLFLFKYYVFAAGILERLLSVTGTDIVMPTMDFLLPVGISFFTFQAISYIVDVKRGEMEAVRNPLLYSLYLSFFPQLVAGPIVRASNLIPQFNIGHRPDYHNTVKGIWMMLGGYFLKLVLADRCALYVDAVFDNPAMHNGGSCLVAALLFPWQIYGDFAGYSLIAVGAARIMGFRLCENFRRPYFSASVSEFWRRWHISLSSWLRDYIYIPLGGGRKRRSRVLGNIMLTFTVSGLWHGASFTYIVWGMMHGGAICVERVSGLGKRRAAGDDGEKRENAPENIEKRGWRAVATAVTFIFVSFAWIFFRADTLSDAAMVIDKIFTEPGVPFLMAADFAVMGVAILLTVLHEYRVERREYKLHCGCGGVQPASDELSEDRGEPSVGNVISEAVKIGLAAAAIILTGVLSGGNFIYFRF